MRKQAKDTITFKPKEETKKLVSGLSDRAKEIIIKRYGLGKIARRMTLEAIGEEYGITRERVRQIENYALASIRRLPEYEAAQLVFDELKALVNFYGGIVHEKSFLDAVSDNEITKNHIHFLLVLSDAFFKIKEDKEFHHRWTTNKEMADKVHQSIDKLCRNFNQDDLVSEEALVKTFLVELQDVVDELSDRQEEVARHWLKISKKLSFNPLGEWGLAQSPNIKMRGIRDYAFLVLRHHGSPMHFTEVANSIYQLFDKKAHPATCHNELIKDDRFVLVGRGLYALVEWGYSKGVVAEVIKNILAKDGPLTKDEIITRVLKERHVKANTIIVNLQNSPLFVRVDDGRYALNS